MWGKEKKRNKVGDVLVRVTAVGAAVLTLASQVYPSELKRLRIRILIPAKTFQGWEKQRKVVQESRAIWLMQSLLAEGTWDRVSGALPILWASLSSFKPLSFRLILGCRHIKLRNRNKAGHGALKRRAFCPCKLRKEYHHYLNNRGTMSMAIAPSIGVKELKGDSKNEEQAKT